MPQLLLTVQSQGFQMMVQVLQSPADSRPGTAYNTLYCIRRSGADSGLQIDGAGAAEPSR